MPTPKQASLIGLSHVASRLTALFCLTLFCHLPARAIDFSGDYTNHFHSGDLVFQTLDGKIAVWFMDGTSKGVSVILAQPKVMPGWRFGGVIPLGDDATAILVQQTSSGTVGASLMSGTHYVRSIILQPCNQVTTPGGRLGCLPSPIPLRQWTLVAHRNSSAAENELFFQNNSGRLLVWHLSNTDSVSLSLADAPIVPVQARAIVVNETSDHTFIPSLVQTLQGTMLALNDSYTGYLSAYAPAKLRDRLLRAGGLHDYNGLGIESFIAQTIDGRVVFLSPGSPGRSTIAGPYTIIESLPVPTGWQLGDVIQ